MKKERRYHGVIGNHKYNKTDTKNKNTTTLRNNKTIHNKQKIDQDEPTTKRMATLKAFGETSLCSKHKTCLVAHA